MKQERRMICIVCPLGCQMTVQIEDGEMVGISGHSCKRGESYAIDEINDPRRTLTTTMRVQGGEAPLVSVKSDAPVPKAQLFECVKRINNMVAEAPVHIGDKLIENVAGTEANIVATCAVPCYNHGDGTDGQRDGGAQRTAPSQQQMAAV